MKKMLFYFLVFPIMAFSQKEPATFTITGKITGLADGTEVKLMTTGSVPSEVAKGIVSKGTFTLTGSVAEPALHTLSAGTQKSFQLYLDNSKISIIGDVKDMEKLKATGSSSHKDFEDFKKAFDPLVLQLNAAASTINSLTPGAERDAMLTTYYSIIANVQKEIDKYVAEKPKSYVTPFMLYVTTQFYDDIALLDTRYNLLDTSIQNSQLGTSLGQYIAYNKVGAIGTAAVDFTQPDTTGTPVSLSSFRGKYVLVDFWASWCGPCRMENPTVVAAHNKFKEKNFTVLGVSLDKPDGREKWINAIHQDSLHWTQVSDLQFWNNAAAQLYHVSGIPFNMLVDPDGKIVGRNLRGPALEAKLCEVLGCN